MKTPALALAAAALTATFFAPTWQMERPRVEHVVVLDVTQSMNVADETGDDGRPLSRLDFAKRRLRQALDELPCGSRLGWAVFTEHRSFLLLAPVEVCANRADLRAVLAGIDGRMAWSGNSEVAKGLNAAVGIARTLESKPSLVFVTDGHEAPPLNPRYRPSVDLKPGEVQGLIVGVGGPKPLPIPKRDPAGRALGTWGADEVLQHDPRSQGRGGSVQSEAMVDDAAAVPAVGLGVTPGSEHLSALREPYLKLLASETGFGYLKLRDADALAQALRAPGLRRPVPVQVDLRLPLAALAFAALLAPGMAARLGGPLRRPRSAQRRA